MIKPKPFKAFSAAAIYGIPDLTPAEEQALPANQRQTLNNKIAMVDKCRLMRDAIDQIQFRARGIPLLDNDEHAAGVREMTEAVLAAYDLVWKAAMHGIK